MAERMMKELFVEGLQKGKWQYFKYNVPIVVDTLRRMEPIK